jgi:hypothetical protein
MIKEPLGRRTHIESLSIVWTSASALHQKLPSTTSKCAGDSQDSSGDPYIVPQVEFESLAHSHRRRMTIGFWRHSRAWPRFDQFANFIISSPTINSYRIELYKLITSSQWTSFPDGELDAHERGRSIR